MSFQDLDEFFDSTLKLPIRGKTYVIESPDAKTGLWCQRILAVAAKVKGGDGEVSEEEAAGLKLDDDEERGLFQRLMGPVFDEMIADRLPWEHIKHAGVTCLMWAAGNEGQAEKYWKSGGQAPKAPAAPQDRKKPKKKSAPQGSPAGSTPRQVVKGEVLPGGTS